MVPPTRPRPSNDFWHGGAFPVKSGGNSKPGGMRPPIRRVLALDAGSQRIKLLLLQSDFGNFHIVSAESIDLRQEGLVAPDEIKSHLQKKLDEMGRPPVAITLPQHLSTSQIIDLPRDSESEVDQLIAEETKRLSGVSESRIIHDFVRTATGAPDRRQFWVTLAQEADIRERVLQLGIEREDLCDVTTTANALIAAYGVAAPGSVTSVLVQLGAERTVLVIVLAGQGAFVASFEMGGNFFTRAIARLKGCAEDAAEDLKVRSNVFQNEGIGGGFSSVVDGWVAEFNRQLSEWFHQHPGRELDDFELIGSGGGFEQPGLREYLTRKAGLIVKAWPKAARAEQSPNPGFEVAFGTALQAIGHSLQPVSLLPDDYRAAWKKRVTRQKIELASLALIAFCALALAVGTWHKLSLIMRKQSLIDKVAAGQQAVEANAALMSDLLGEYEVFRPVLRAQQGTVDMLKTIQLLQSSRGTQSFWYVLLADQQTYFSAPSSAGATNRSPSTNLAAIIERSSVSSPAGAFPSSTNGSPARPGMIAELTIPGPPEASRAILGSLVNGLKRDPLYSRVDLLSEDLRRNLAETNVYLADRDYVLQMDFAETDFQYSPTPKKPANGGGSSPRRGSRGGAAASTRSEPVSRYESADGKVPSPF